jgi:hypothetical protein
MCHYTTLSASRTANTYQSDTVGGCQGSETVGYEVYRSGVHELQQPNAEKVLIGFYSSLFERYSLFTMP